MRRFSSYGSVDKDIHYYAPRKELLSRAFTQLVGDDYLKGGHYITVWAPRQTGKTWVMQQILFQVQKDPRFDVLKINLETYKSFKNASDVIKNIAQDIGEGLGKKFRGIKDEKKFLEIFRNDVLEKPLILILDEFDALPEIGISAIVSAFRNIYFSRMDEIGKNTDQKTYLLHGVALIGVRSVLGIENEKGSPFNVQRSLHIPDLTFQEVAEMFKWYEKESGQRVEPEVVEALYKETNGQPGLTCWFGEILTEGCEFYKNDTSRPIGINDFENIYQLAMAVLPNNNILNIISKARMEPYREKVINLFKTEKPVKFAFDDRNINFLYMNGVIDPESVPGDGVYVKFASPFVQKRLFNFFSNDIFKEMGELLEPFYNVKEFYFPDRLDIEVMLEHYQAYLDENKGWLFKDAPRRSDMRVYEAVFHFNLYAYFDELLRGRKARVYPEFPTGNGKIDILIKYNQVMYGIELKSFKDRTGNREALEQTAQYGRKLGLKEIYLVSFIESIDEANKKKYETLYQDASTEVMVKPVIIQTGRV